jgi:predicted dehydrogenase
MTVRIGIVGAGGVAVTHLINLLRIPDAEVVAIADVVPGAAEACIRRVNAQQDLNARPGDEPRRLRARIYGDYRAMLAEAGLHALYICTPPAVRGEIELAAVSEGVALCVEKPVALDLGVAREVGAAIRESNLVSSVCYQVRYARAVDDARRALEGRAVAMGLGFMVGGVPAAPWWRSRATSGGQLVEQATHTVNLMSSFLGDVGRVYAAGALRVYRDVPGFDIHDTGAVTLHFASGVIGSIVTTAVLGNGATAGFPTGLHLFAPDLRVEVWGATLRIVTADRTDERRYAGSPMQILDAEFVEAVRRRDPSRVRTPYADAIRTLAITLAGEESARTGRVVEVSRV